MPSRIGDYALIGDCHTAGLIGRDGSLDWLCFPRFDSEACFAALLGTKEHGRWLIAPDTKIREVRRRYQENTLILETEYTTDSGTVALIDFMSLSGEVLDVVRIVEGRGGKVPLRSELIVRLDTGQTVPWVRAVEEGIVAVAGAEALHLKTDVPQTVRDSTTFGEFTVSEGQRLPFVLTFFPSYTQEPQAIDPEEALAETGRWWRDWAGRCTYEGPYREAVVRSLITLKALTYQPTGGIIAGPTTSLPANIGGERNWDYRYCWLRDATLSLHSLLIAGYHEEACAWRDWLLRAVGGKPSQLQPIYGIAGERRMVEYEADWLPGFRNSRPIRIGNANSKQLQLDAYGELMDIFHTAREKGIPPEPHAWDIQKLFLADLEELWDKPDHGIWEIRGDPHQYTYSKITAWVAMDRGVKAIEKHGLDGPVEKWKSLREKIHRDVCKNGFSKKRNAFVQTYGGHDVDASLLRIPFVGFLPIEDDRVRGTVDAVQKHLCENGLVRRYDPKQSADTFKSFEGSFLICSFWLAGCLALMGRREEAVENYERLLDLRNDVGLLAEEYDTHSEQFLGNFPQAFSHLALISTAFDLLPGERQ